MWMFIVSFFTNVKSRIQMTIISKMCFNYIMEYYLLIKRNEVLIHATAPTNLINMLSERSQTYTHTHIIHRIYMKCPE
jgi:hypothetical protein